MASVKEFRAALQRCKRLGSDGLVHYYTDNGSTTSFCTTRHDKLEDVPSEEFVTCARCANLIWRWSNRSVVIDTIRLHFRDVHGVVHRAETIYASKAWCVLRCDPDRVVGPVLGEVVQPVTCIVCLAS